MTQETFTTPVGRLVQGDLYKPNEKDADGNPRVYKSGPNTGKPRPEFYIALAIPKAPGQHWAASPWGAAIWKVGHAFMAQASNMPAFAWKIRDGDSQVPNRKGKRPCDQEGFPGHWILSMASGYAPKIYSMVGTTEPVLMEQPGAVNLGDFVEVYSGVDGNGSAQQPGVFVNLSMVCLRAYGPRIVTGPDVASAGFGGGGPLPAGAMMTPAAGFAPPALPGSGTPAAPSTGYPAAPMAGQPPAPPGTAPSSIAPPPMVPNPQFLGHTGAVPPVPGVPGAPGMPMPPVPAAPAGPVMTPAAQGATYAAMIGAGWTDATLRQHGMML